MAENPVKVEKVDEEQQGQPQAQNQEPHDGKVRVREVDVTTDEVILDPNSELAVQVPEGVGARHDDFGNPLVEAYEKGTADEQLSKESESSPRSESKSKRSE